MDHPDRGSIDSRLVALFEKSERDGGVWVKDIPEGTIVSVHARDSLFVVAFTDAAAGSAVIQGSGQHCPSPTLCRVNGSTWGESMIKLGWIGRGMHLEAALGQVGSITEEALRNRRTLTTASIRAITVEHNPERAKELIATAKKYELKEPAPK